MSDKIEILVYGLGAIGSFYAFILQRSQNVRLSVVARSNYEAVKTNGILIKSDNHGEHHFHPAAVLKSPKDAGHSFDYILCANKAVDLHKTAQDLEPVVDQGKTTIVLMQNGVGNEDPFHEIFPKCTILSGVVWVGATQYSPGVVRQHVAESTTIGLFTNTNVPESTQIASLNTFASILAEGKHPYTTTPEIQTARWKKVIWNCAWNSLNTLSGVECQTWLKSTPYAMATTQRLMLEAIHVAQALGVPGIEDGLVDELIGRMQGYSDPVWTSMYHDSRAGRAMEVDIILGNIVKKGHENNVATPTIETLYALLLALGQRLDSEKHKTT